MPNPDPNKVQTPEQVAQAEYDKRHQSYAHKPHVGKFRVIVGKHHEGGRVYRVGDVVHSKSNLLLQNHPTDPKGMKFERVQDDTVISDGTPMAAVAPPPVAVPIQPVPPPPQPHTPDTLDTMSVQELRKVAEAEEIDLGRTNDKAGIIAIIRKSGAV